MGTIQDTFEKSLKNYSGSKAKILIVDDFVLKLKQELAEYFCSWLSR